MAERHVVLITRPEPGLSATANQLDALGFQTIKMPLAQIEQISFLMPDLKAIDAILFTSQNAVAAFAVQNINVKNEISAFCVGSQTAKAAQILGFKIADIAPDAKTLAATLITKLSPHSNLIYFCGVQRKPELETALTISGHNVTAIEVYRSQSLKPDQETLKMLAHHQSCHAVLLYAPSAAHALGQTLKEYPDLAAALTDSRALCLSKDVALALISDLREKSSVARKPNEQSLFALLINQG